MHVKRFAAKSSMTEEEAAVRKAVLAGDNIAITPNQEVAALKGDVRFRLEPMTRREKRARNKGFKAKGKGFTK